MRDGALVLREHLEYTMLDTGARVRFALSFNCAEGDELAASDAQQGLRAARLLGLYLDDEAPRG